MSRRRLVQLLLQREYQTLELEDGDSAVTAYLKHEPDIIFLALDLPNLDGHVAALEIREHASQARIVLIAPRRLRSLAEDASFSAGAVGWLERPITDSLLATSWSKIMGEIPLAPGIEDLDELYPENQERLEEEVINLLRKQRQESTTPDALDASGLKISKVERTEELSPSNPKPPKEKKSLIKSLIYILLLGISAGAITYALI